MKTKNENLATRTKKNNINLAIWTSAWVLSQALAAFGPKLLWDFNDLLTILFVVVNIGFGIGMILANKRYLDDLDELHRKIYMEAMAITLGVAVVGGLAYSMLDIGNVILFDAEISHLVFLIGITYLISVIVGNFRYK